MGLISLAGCTQVTISEDGITWDDGTTDTSAEPARETPVERATEAPDDASTAEDDEIDLSEYEDGSFSGGSPSLSTGIRDGVEITVTAAGVDEKIQLFRETTQFEYNEDLLLRDDLNLVENDDGDDNDSVVVRAEVIEINETADDDEDDDE